MASNDNDNPNNGNGNNNNNERQIVASGEIQEVAEPIHICRICLDGAAYAVVSFCGHLFCWPCIYRWMKSRPAPSRCPLCHSLIGRNTLIPVNGTFDDRHLVNERMEGIPERRACPSIGEQRRHFIQNHMELNRFIITPPHLKVLGPAFLEACLPNLERARPLHPELLPRRGQRFEVILPQHDYLLRLILFLVVYFILQLWQ